MGKSREKRRRRERKAERRAERQEFAMSLPSAREDDDVPGRLEQFRVETMEEDRHEPPFGMDN